jgi:hypothetical protein
MTQGKASKEEAKATKIAVDEMFEAIPKRKSLDYIGHLNDICLFLEACIRELPSEEKPKEAVP